MILPQVSAFKRNFVSTDKEDQEDDLISLNNLDAGDDGSGPDDLSR